MDSKIENNKPEENTPPKDHSVENIIGGKVEEEVETLDLSKLEQPQHEKRTDKIKNSIKEHLDLKGLNSTEIKDAETLIEHVGNVIEDIHKIESGKKLTYQALQKNSTRIKNDIQMKMDSFRANKRVDMEGIRFLVGDILDSTGPNRDTSQLLLGLQHKSDNYISLHTMNVTLLCITLGIELSKAMEAKLKTKDVASDFKKIRLCTKKMFNREELIDIGVSAFLHDLHLHRSFPNLNENTKFDLKMQSQVERHPAEAYHFLKTEYPMAELDIHRAVYQHHEFINGAGSPNGTEGKFFGRYSGILSFSTFLIERTTPNPFFPFSHPRRVLWAALKDIRAQFDADVLMAFLRGASFFPIGSWYILNTGEIGYVCGIELENLHRPVFRAVYNKSFQVLPEAKTYELIDLEQIKILKEIDRRVLYQIVPDFQTQYALLEKEEAEAKDAIINSDNASQEESEPKKPDLPVVKSFDNDDIDEIDDLLEATSQEEEAPAE